jgi:hypothetical protein
VFEREARRVLGERRQALTQPRNIEDTRLILRELLAAPLRFTPILEEGRRGYRFNSALSLAGIFGSDLAVRSLASPGRIELPA